MLRWLKPFLSLFLLTIFLFPSLVKEVHSADHEQRLNCDANGEQHFHVQHHDCTLCDFVLPVVSTPGVSENDLTQLSFAEYIFPEHAPIYFSSFRFSSALLRAPPVC